MLGWVACEGWSCWAGLAVKVGRAQEEHNEIYILYLATIGALTLYPIFEIIDCIVTEIV